MTCDQETAPTVLTSGADGIESVRADIRAGRWRQPAWVEALVAGSSQRTDEQIESIALLILVDANPHWRARFEAAPPEHLTVAIRCLGSLRTPPTHDTTRRVFRELLDYFEFLALCRVSDLGRGFPSTRDRWAREVLLPTVRDTSHIWSDTTRWTFEQPGRILLMSNTYLARPFSELLVAVTPDYTREQWTALLEHRGAIERAAAVFALAEHFGDDATRARIITVVESDVDFWVRGMALETLAHQWSDDHTRGLLVRHLKKETRTPVGRLFRYQNERWELTRERKFVHEQFVNITALENLTVKWRDDETRQRFHDVARDGSRELQMRALECLVRDWRDLEARAYLYDQATSDQGSRALKIVVRHAPTQPMRSWIVNAIGHKDRRPPPPLGPHPFARPWMA